jgi:hypothetical protein
VVAYAPIAAMMPSIAARPLTRSAFSFMILLVLGVQCASAEAEVEIASDGV